MIDAKQPDAAKKYHIEDGALAEGEGAVAVSKDGIYVHGNVVGDVLGAGAIKVTITEETTSGAWTAKPVPGTAHLHL